MSRQAEFPMTGEPVSTHEAARAKARRHADKLDDVRDGKSDAATFDGRSTSDKNAAFVKRTSGDWVPGNRDRRSGVTRTS